jgi:hypothetical protein
MMIMKHFLFITALFLLFLNKGFSQINIIFIADVYGRSIDGLGNFQIQNLFGQPKKGQVRISVRENISKTQVVTIVSPSITVNPGNSAFPVSAFAVSLFNFSSNSLAAIVSQTRNFPPGEYTFCYLFVPADKGDDFENCFDASVQPLVPISLINPADQDKICQKRPPLSWQPPVPFPPSMRFRLQLTEKKQGAAVENLLMNAPLILLDNIPTTTVNYPSFAPDLKEGSTYVWQVIAYQNGIILSRSEIWEFTVQCNDPVKPMINDSYRELKNLVNGNYYYATRGLKFSYRNIYNVKKLIYELYATDNSTQKIKNLPDIVLTTGLNKVDIDLTTLDLEDGKHYVLKVYPFNEPDVTIRFVYQENDPLN